MFREEPFPEDPRQFTLENRQDRKLYRNRRQRLRHLTHALPALCLNHERTAIKNWLWLVQKLCRTPILCGKKRKKRGGIQGPENLHKRAVFVDCGEPQASTRRLRDNSGLSTLNSS
jgi:hypothetical protein